MSLAQHVTALQGFDREPATPQTLPSPQNDLLPVPGGLPAITGGEECSDLDKPQWRRLSFDAFAPRDETLALIPSLAVPHEAAYKVPTAIRVLQVLTGVFMCAVASGIIFGFAAIKPVLIAEGVYSELCDADSAVLRADDDDPSSLIPCAAQDLRLNLFFISGSISANVACLCAGAMLDRFGRRLCYIIAAFLLAVGSILMGSAFAIPEFDGYLVANITIALGGTFILVPSFELANAFPRHGGIILALVTGSFDLSAAVFLLYKTAWDASGRSFSPHKFFFAYAAVVPSLLLLAEWAYMPAGAYHTTPELEEKIGRVQDGTGDVHSSDEDIPDALEVQRRRSSRASQRIAKLDRIEQLLGDAEEREERVKLVEEIHEAAGVWGVLHGMPAHRQMMTPWFVFVLASTIVQMMRMNFFIATVRSQYRYMLGGDSEADDINTLFDVALPIGGMLSTPFIGILLNHMSVGTTWAMLSLCVVGLGIFNCIRTMWAGYVTVIIFVVFRPLFYSAVSDYSTKVFGFATFGRIYGTLTCVAGITQLLQSGIDALVHGPLHDNPIPVNAVFAFVGSVFAAALTVYIFVKGSHFRKEQDAAFSPDETHLLIAVPEEEYGTIV